MAKKNLIKVMTIESPDSGQLLLEEIAGCHRVVTVKKKDDSYSTTVWQAMGPGGFGVYDHHVLTQTNSSEADARRYHNDSVESYKNRSWRDPSEHYRGRGGYGD